jgi:1,4-alpha-glucan branching enzyme
MTVPPTGRYGLLAIPAPGAASVTMRYAALSQRDRFNPAAWAPQALVEDAASPGWWNIDLDAMGLADGVYEYEFLLAGNGTPIADPYADTITRFGGYRGLFRISGNIRVPQQFRWDDEFNQAYPLRQNNQIVIYELAVKLIENDPAESNPLAELGTFEKLIFERLDYLVNLGINCIELLPIEDTSQTLDWGYGTRFYFAPDFDMGTPIDAKFFIKSCHQRGIRVILDVVMNFHHQTCPLNALSPVPGWFSVQSGTDGRTDFGQILFRYNDSSYGNYFAAREFLCQMAEYWVKEYHVDGFRIDDFADIKNWDFGQGFRQCAWAASNANFPGKPFIVIAEDSRRDFAETGPAAYNGSPVVDAIWNFGFRDEIRALALDQITTVYGQPSRTERVQHLLSQQGVWNPDYGNGHFDPGFSDLACSVAYATSHDVADAPRLMNTILGSILVEQGLGTNTVANIRSVIDNPPPDLRFTGAIAFALYRVFGVFALLMTAVGIPMFYAGEEFADVHDLDNLDVNKKQQDPVQWARAAYPGQAALLTGVANLVRLHTRHPALQRNEISFFYFHPQFDDNAGCRVFGYARTAGNGIGNTGQVIVLANMGAEKFPVYVIPNWPWGGRPLTEAATPGAPGPMPPPVPVYDGISNSLTLALDAFQVRVFTS